MNQPPYPLPEHFVKTILGVHPEEGAQWVAAFPQFLAQVAERYDLTIGPPFALSYNYVCAATRQDGAPVVLKLSPPYGEFAHEVEALRHYAGSGAVALLDADTEQGIAILERVYPGVTLHELTREQDEEATHIAAEVMKKLWRPIDPDHNTHDFPTVAKWAQGLQRLRDDHGGGTGPLPAHLVERAEAIYRQLFAGAPAPVLLHGDLHHENILSATREPFLAIDAKGVIGEAAYEVGPFFYNPQPELGRYPDLVPVFRRRMAILVEHLGFEREHLIACAFAHSVLSAAWSIEDGDAGGWQDTIRVSEALLRL